MRTALVLVTTVSLLLPSCGGSQTPPASGGTPPSGATEAAAASGDAATETAAIDWEKMSQRERIEHMKKVVVPRMSAVFQAQDAEEYANFNCVTCHGPGAERGEYDMPSAALPKLPPNGDFKELEEQEGPMMAFMAEKVVPEMASSLGMAPATGTGKGFGCYDCHMTK